MRTIDVKGNAEDPGRVLGVMLFPNDQAMREQFMATRLTELEVSRFGDGARLEVDARTLRLLLEAPSREEMGRTVAEATKRATYSGDILSMVYLMDRFKDRHPAFDRPSINKAVAFCKEFGLMHKFGDGDKMYYSEKKIRECWDEFKPVAHLWAAFRINKAYPFQRDAFGSAEGLYKFLGVAAGIYNFGASFVPKASKPPVPILDPTTAWLIPESIAPMSLYSDRLPDQLAAYAANYKAAV